MRLPRLSLQTTREGGVVQASVGLGGGGADSPAGRNRRRPGSPPVIEVDLVSCSVQGLEGPCHVFRGCKVGGYGQVRHNGKLAYVHRYVWERDVGPIPKGLVIDHLCRNPGCCNVKHLRVTTQKVNNTENVVGAAWQLNKIKTHCPRGHEYNSANTYWRKDRPGNRECKQCQRVARRKSKMKRRRRVLA